MSVIAIVATLVFISVISYFYFFYSIDLAYILNPKKIWEWKKAENMILSSCIFEKDLQISESENLNSPAQFAELLNKIDFLSVYPNNLNNNDQGDSMPGETMSLQPLVKDENYTCWIQYKGDYQGEGTISFKTQSNKVVTVRVKDFPIQLPDE